MQLADGRSRSLGRCTGRTVRERSDRPSSRTDRECPRAVRARSLGSVSAENRESHASRLSTRAGGEEGAGNKSLRDGATWVIRQVFLKSGASILNGVPSTSAFRTGK